MAANSAAVPEDRRGPITGLPSGVDYTCIKRFFLELPPWMTTLAWMTAPTAEDPAWRGFAGKTFRTVDRLLRQREAALAQRPPDEVAEAHRTVTALRAQWIHQLLDELRRRTAGSLWVVARLRRRPGPGLTRSVTHVEAWTFARTRLRLLERRTIAPAVKHWHGDRVDHLDLDVVHAALVDVIRTHARIFSVGGVGPAGVRSAALPAGPPSRGTPSRGSTTICVRSMRSGATAMDASFPRQDTIPSSCGTTSAASCASNGPISRVISPSRMSRRRFSITSGRPHRTALWASSSAQNFMGQDEEQRRDFLTSTPRVGSGTLDACIGAIPDPSVTTSRGRARAP
jgi:hypothetical protein